MTSLRRRWALGRVRTFADEDLMACAADGNQRALEVVYERHAGAAYALAYRMCGTRPSAEEVVQEAFVSLWRSADRYQASRGSLRTWLLSIVHRRAIDSLRRVSARPAVAGGADVPELPAEDRTDGLVERREVGRVVREALRSLPREQAQAIELAYFGGYTQTEIAEMLGAPLGTVKGRMRLGMEKLRHQLEEVAL